MTAPKKYAYQPYFQEISKRLKRNVRHRREELNLTVYEAAERSGMHWRHWQKIEAGQNNVTLQTGVRLARGLEVDLSDLVGSQLWSTPKTSAIKHIGKHKKCFRHRVHRRRMKR